MSYGTFMRKKYRQVKAPSDYPGRVYAWRGRVLEHHLIWWQYTGEIVPDGYDVHHKNEDGKDNRFTNLELKPHGRHTADHHLVGNPLTKVACALCKSIIWKPSRVVRAKRAAGQLHFFCSKSHAAIFQGQTPHPFRHGTVVAYGYHCCRCTVCRKAHSARINAYQKKQRAIRLAAGR